MTPEIPKISFEEAEAMNRDSGLQSLIGGDELLNKLFHEELEPLGLQNLEISVITGGRVVIAGHEYPAPAAAVFAHLELIDSPFVHLSDNRDPELIDVFRALYLLRKREIVAPQLLEISRRQYQLDRLAEHVKNPGAEAIEALHRLGQDLAEAWTKFDADVLAFGESLEAFNYSTACSEIQLYLSMSGGFKLLPPEDNPQESKKNGVDSMPSGSPESSRWWARWLRLILLKLPGVCHWLKLAS